MTSVPSRIVEVSRARPASVRHESVGPGRPSPDPIDRKWSERKNAEKPHSSVFLATARTSSYVAPCWGSVKMRRSVPSVVRGSGMQRGYAGECARARAA